MDEGLLVVLLCYGSIAAFSLCMAIHALATDYQLVQDNYTLECLVVEKIVNVQKGKITYKLGCMLKMHEKDSWGFVNRTIRVYRECLLSSELLGKTLKVDDTVIIPSTWCLKNLLPTEY